MQSEQRIQQHLPLTEVEFEIMLSLCHAPAHGYAVMKQVAERTEQRLKLRAGSLYRAIHRLEKKILVEAVALQPGEDQRRRRYTLTELGTAVLRAEAKRLSLALQAARALIPAGEEL